jgi:uncharacterized membrane protein
MAKPPRQTTPAQTPAHLQSQSRQSALVSEQRLTIRQTPLPNPEDLEGYDKALPGLAREIVDMAKAEQQIRLAALDWPGCNFMRLYLA